MGILRKITPGSRKLSIFLIAISVAGFFFALYFLKYLPANKEELNNRGFRILRQMSNNITDKNSEYKTRLYKNIKSLSGTDNFQVKILQESKNLLNGEREVEALLKQNVYLGNDLVLRPIEFKDSSQQPARAMTRQRLNRLKRFNDTTVEINVRFLRNDTSKLQFVTRVITDSLISYIRIECDLNRFLTSIINSRNDLFEHYLIMKDPHNTDHADNVFYDSKEDLIYQSGNLGLTNVSDFDSLFTRSSNDREYGVNEMKLSGTQYTMFVQPLEWNRKKLVLIGLLKKGSYNSRALSISPELIYTAIIILLLLVCSLPFVKVLLITPGERLMVKDVVMTGVSLILGTALIVIVVTDWFLFRTLEKKNQRTLSNLSDTLYNGFEKEVGNGYKQIKYYDSTAMAKQEELIDRSPKADSLFVRPSYYKIFDQVFWTDSAGMQKVKWQTDSKLSPMLDYSDRNYIKKIVADDAYDLPDSKIDGKFYIEPVYSNTTGEYKVNLSVKSNLPLIKNHILQALDSAKAHNQSDSILVLRNYEYVNPDHLPGAPGAIGNYRQVDLIVNKDPSLQVWHREQIESFKRNAARLDSCKVACLGTRMFTEPIPLLPPEYGFCLIDQDGRVLVHSDVKRSLLENLIAETNNDVQLKQAIKKREDKLISNILYYGDKHELRIRPVHNLPFYIVTFYNKNYLVDANSRMVVFALSICVTFFVLLLLTHMILRFRDQSSFKLNFTPLKSDWFRPQKNAPRELDRMRQFITLYTTGMIFLSILYSLFIAKDFWVVLFTVFFIPFYVFMGVSAIKSFHIPNKLSGMGYFLLAVLMLLINFTFLYYLQNDQVEDEGQSVYLYGTCFHLLSMGYIVYLFRKFGRKAQLKEKETPEDKLVSYGMGFTPDMSKYAFTTIAILVVVSVLPPVATLYYAYKEEKLQNVKMRQLDLANDIQLRARRVYARHLNGKGKYKKTVYAQTYTKDFRDSLVTKLAIFSGDSVIQNKIAKTRDNVQGDLANQSFYENLLSFIPDVSRMQDSSYQLNNRTSDNTWYWKQTSNYINPKISLTFNGMGEQKKTITIDSLASPYESGTSYARWFAVMFAIIIAGLLYGIYVLVKMAGRKIFMIGYREDLKDCLVEESFIEKFSKHIELYKMVILDQDGQFAKQIRRPNGHCKQIVEGSSLADFHRIITGPNKEKVLVLTLLRQQQSSEFNGSRNGNGHVSDLLEITETDFRQTLPEHWKPILIVKPRKLKHKEKYPKELLDLHNLDEWTKVAIGSMGKYFTLINKTQYISLLHHNLEDREMKPIMLNTQHPEKFPDDNFIFNMQREFADTYEALWQDCTPEQKFVLHDFATDGFANYKNEATIDSIIRKGLLIYKNDSLQLMSNSFRNYILEKTGSPELTAIQSGLNKSGSWDIFKIVLFVIIVAVALFIFFTQEEVFKQISAAIASLVALVTMLFKFVEQSKQLPKAV